MYLNYIWSKFAVSSESFISYYTLQLWSGITQSVQGLVTGWTVRGSNSGGGEVFRNLPDRFWGPPSLLYNRYRVFLCGKAAEAWCSPPTQCRAEIKERVELYLFSTSGPSRRFLGWTFTFTFCILRLLLTVGVIILYIKCLMIFVYTETWTNIMKTKINQQNAQINSGLIYYWSITPTCFGPSVEAIIREFEIFESYKTIVLIC